VIKNQFESEIYSDQFTDKYSDHFSPLTPFQLAEAFPDERSLALRRRRELLSRLVRYDEAIGDVYTSKEHDNDTKRILVVCIQTWKKLDPATEELRALDQYLSLIPKRKRKSSDQPAKPAPVQKALNIEKAKSVPLEDLLADVAAGRTKHTATTIVACCPFHAERTPSFTIYKKTNRYHCFSCHESGDSIQFYMKTRNVDFRTAVEALS
jgi:hypothetical protein